MTDGMAPSSIRVTALRRCATRMGRGWKSSIAQLHQQRQLRADNLIGPWAAYLGNPSRRTGLDGLTN